MPKLAYMTKRFGAESRDIIARAQSILAEYTAQGYRLTLRQLYYQFVARAFIPNSQRSYNRLGSIIADARMAGLIDWSSIEDRGRWLRAPFSWADPDQWKTSVQNSAEGYVIDKWKTQERRIEVWIEKDALVGIIQRPCDDNQIGYLACRGYTSATAVWEAAYHRYLRYIKAGQAVTILHLGDHDPSGLDMTRDIRDRLSAFILNDTYRAGLHIGTQDAMGDFLGRYLEVERIALNMDQVRQYNPPPNPAKLTDTRSNAYIAEYGMESWELDALEPSAIEQLILDAIEERKDVDAWDTALEEEEEQRNRLIEAVSTLEVS